MGNRSYLLLLLTLGKGRVGTGAETTAGALLRRAGFLLTRGILLAVILVVVLICRTLLVRSKILRGESVRS